MPVINQNLFASNFLLILMLLTSCNQTNNQEDLNKEIQSISSWAATVQMVGNAWLKGNVPSKYTQQTLNKSQSELVQEKNKISHIKPQTNIVQSYQSLVLANVNHLASQTEKISQAIEQNNHSLAQKELTELETELQKLHQLKTKLKASYEKNS